MKISIISGSHRRNAQSLKVARHIERTLLEQGLCEQAWLYSLSDNPLPLWDESIWDGSPEWAARLATLRGELQSSDALVVVTPEWHGQVPAGLKNLLLLLGRDELAHKPGMIVAVSSADGGAYPVAELRMSSYKNNRLCWIPEHVIVRNVERVLNEDAASNDAGADTYFRDRLVWALGILREYGLALRQVRASAASDFTTYRNGM